jgi:hypothetical protein
MTKKEKKFNIIFIEINGDGETIDEAMDEIIKNIDIEDIEKANNA